MDGLLDPREVLARRRRQVDVLDERSPERPGDDRPPPICNEPTPDLRAKRFAKLLETAIHLLLRQARLDRCRIFRLEVAPKSSADRVQVESPQHPIQVVRPTHRTPGLHAGEAVHGETGDGVHQPTVRIPKSGEQRSDQILHVGISGAGAPGAGDRLTVEHHLLLGDRVDRGRQGEEGLERRFERLDVPRALDQRRPERSLQSRPGADVDVFQGSGGVDRLHHRDGNARFPQLPDEGRQELSHQPAAVSSASPAATRSMSG